ncbi:MAG: Rho termination factor N-terminal domain-containing protein, partial [Chitinophagaceae bacterium]
MYDILQLNDMLVPELLDIAEQLKIPNYKKLSKQELVYKIVDRQAVLASEANGQNAEDKGKKKRIIKATTAHTTEEADVMSGGEESIKRDSKKELMKKRSGTEKPAPPLVRKSRKKADEEEQLAEQSDYSAGDEAGEDEEMQESPETSLAEENTEAPAAETAGAQRTLPLRRESSFNIEFDGIILGEGVLEMMPDGYGFLRS